MGGARRSHYLRGCVCLFSAIRPHAFLNLSFLLFDNLMHEFFYNSPLDIFPIHLNQIPFCLVYVVPGAIEPSGSLGLRSVEGTSR